MRTLGARLHAEQLNRTLLHLFSVNERVTAQGAWPTPVCIWGSHGIGKTMLVEQLAKSQGMRFAYCAPAQFEEMGDLNGMPQISAEGTTRFAPPEWVPKGDGPGILLLDDINRADDRILRGLMQLLQTGGLVSWQLPKGWQVVATANPEGADYSVTPMDDAMLTRMQHVTMEFDVDCWVHWAQDNGVDQRGIEFVVGYPEVVTGRRTTPRSLTAFFRSIETISNLKTEQQLVQILALSSLDDSTVAAFVDFIQRDKQLHMPQAQEVLEAEDMQALLLQVEEEQFSVDRLGLICQRVVEFLLRDDYMYEPLHGTNLIKWLVEAPLPGDLRMSMHRELVTNAKNTKLLAALEAPSLARLLLAGL